MTQNSRPKPSSQPSSEKLSEERVAKDILYLLADKGSMSIYMVAKMLQTRDGYGELNWNAVRMRVTRVVYRLVLAGMLEYRRGTRSAKKLDLSYRYLYGEQGIVPEDILVKLGIKLEDIPEKPQEILEYLEEKIGESILFIIRTLVDDPDRDLVASLIFEVPISDKSRVARVIAVCLKPDLFKGWYRLAKRIEDYYYDALVRKVVREEKLLPMGLAYILANAREYKNELYEYLRDVVSDEIIDVCGRYCNTDKCTMYIESEKYFFILEEFKKGVRDYIDSDDKIDLLLAKHIVPKVLDTLMVNDIIAEVKTLYTVSGNMVSVNDIKNLFKKTLTSLSTKKEYIGILRETAKLLLPHISRLARLIEAEAIVYRGFEEALREILNEAQGRH